MRRLLPLLPVVALVSCGAAPTSTTGENAAPSDVQLAAFSRINQFRQAANVPPVSLRQALDVSATKHAGYQAIRYAAYPGDPILTHYESADHPPVKDGTPDSTNALYVGVNLLPRMLAANGGNFFFSGVNVFSEDISTVSAGDASVKSLWNTVYHRLPMCRHETQLYGYGDAETAYIEYGDKHPPNVAGWGTHDFVGQQGATITASFWPENNGKFIVPSFNTDTEVPDPLAPSTGPTMNQHQTPAPAPDAGTVGNPLHFIAPTSANWSSVTVTLNDASTPGTQLPVYVLAGYLKLDPSNPQDHVASPPPVALASGVDAWDDELEAGELFVLPQAPLGSGVVYQYSITGTAGATFTTNTVSFTTQ